ncbi:MAG: serine hydrolase domain-containing protein [Chitinophagaceae bacterium]
MSSKSVFNCLKVLSLLICMLFFQYVHAQYDFTQLDKKIEGYKIVIGRSVSCVIYKNNKIVYKRDVENFDIKTPAEILSSSQWLTTALILNLVDAGKLSLDDNVAQYLPIFTKYGKKYISIRHCLTHKTGLEAESGVLKMFEKNNFESLEACADAYASKREIVKNPGEEFKYSNVGINLAARVAEIVGKRGFEQLVNERIFRPLGMRSTSFNSNGKAPNPSGGAVTSALDFANFLNMLLNKGKFNDKQILSEKSVDEMVAIQAEAAKVKDIGKVVEGFGYGMGCFIQEADEKGKAIVASFPSFYGTLPWIDFCRGYVCVIFSKGSLIETKMPIYVDLKNTVDAIIGGENCK